MRIIIFSVFSVLIFTCLVSQAQNKKTIQLYPLLKLGDVKKYKISTSDQTIANRVIESNNKTTKDITIKIVGIRGDIVDLEWVNNNVNFTELIPQNNPLINFMKNLDNNITIKYSINNKGCIVSVTNYNEISSKINASIDSLIILMLNDTTLTKAFIEDTEFQLKMMFLTKQQIDEIILCDIFKFHLLYGETYNLGEPKLISNTSNEFSVKLTSINVPNSKCRFEIKNKKLSRQFYDYGLSDNWLLKYSSSIKADDPIIISQYYEIKLMQ